MTTPESAAIQKYEKAKPSQTWERPKWEVDRKQRDDQPQSKLGKNVAAKQEHAFNVGK